MNSLKAGSSVHYLAHPEWGPGRVQWITRAGLLMVRFVNARPMYEGEFAAGELSEAAPVEVAA